MCHVCECVCVWAAQTKEIYQMTMELCMKTAWNRVTRKFILVEMLWWIHCIHNTHWNDFNNKGHRRAFTFTSTYYIQTIQMPLWVSRTTNWKSTRSPFKYEKELNSTRASERTPHTHMHLDFNFIDRSSMPVFGLFQFLQTFYCQNLFIKRKPYTKYPHESRL